MKSFLTASIFLMSSLTVIAQSLQLDDKIINDLLEKYPGISIAVGRGDSLIVTAGYGYADAKSGEKVNPDHVFRYYSLSKSITGIMLIKLHSDGALDFDKSVRFYLPDLPESYQAVKVIDIINHSAGIRHYKKGEWMKVSSVHCDNPIESINSFINDPLESVPGNKYSYSSFGYVLLSAVIEKISGKSFTEYLNQEILNPLGISGIFLDQEVEGHPEVQYYEKWSRNKAKPSDPVINSCKFGGGGLVGTAEAITRLQMAMMNGLIVQEDMRNKYYSQLSTRSGEPTGYAFGIGDNRTEGGLRYHFHSGSAVGSNSALLVYEPFNGSPVIVITILGNLNDDFMNSLIGKLASNFQN